MAVCGDPYTNGSRFFVRVMLIGLLHLCLCLSGGDGTSEEGNCIESERRALLAIKVDIYDPDQWFSSWRDQDCCRWRGIDCDNTTGHVVKLDLRYPYDFDAQDESKKYPGPSKVNPSLLDLMHLKYLDLSLNNFSGASIPKFIGSLVHLTYLNLSNAEFSGSVPPELGNLFSLQFLDLNSNYNYYYLDDDYYYYYYSSSHGWSLHANDLLWLSRIRSLQHLDLSGINLTKAANWHYEINMHSSLLKLYLSNTSLPSVRVPLSHVNLTSLKVLDLSLNDHIQTIVPRLLSNISSSLVHLNLHGCGFPSKLLIAIGDLHNLHHLDLFSNQITYSREIFQKLGNLSRLEYLVLSFNQISIDVSQLLGNVGHLKYLDLSLNKIYGEIPEKLGNLTNLETLYIIENRISGTIPKSIGNLHNLVDLDLSWNQNISGKIPKSIGNLVRLQNLDLSFNMISGEIPDVFDRLHNLQYLGLEWNHIIGKIPRSIGNLCQLKALYLSNNNISGEIVDIIESWSKCIENRLDGGSSLYGLTSLDVSDNNLSGLIPKSLGRLFKLEYLDLASNSFTGCLNEAHFANLTRLSSLDLSENLLEVSKDWIPSFNARYIYMSSCHLGPKFPTWLRTQTNLRFVWLSENSISDDFPAWFWDLKHVSDLDISHNSMKGRLPTSLKGQQYESIDMSSNNFHGLLPEFLDPSQLALINLSNNSFEGPIPLSFARATGLWFLSLSNNHINGSVPPFICNLTYLAILDLSNNNLFGSLPNCLDESQPRIVDSQKGSMPKHSQSSTGGLINLQSLHMRNNSLSGGFPLFLRYSKQLAALDLSDNKFSGNVPIWIGESLTSLRVLSLRSNFFSGNIPEQLSYLSSLQVLDLACNKFSGDLPPSFGNFSAMMSVENSEKPFLTNYSNYYTESILITTKGLVMDYTSVLSLVMGIDLSQNNLSGMIPEKLVHLHGLRFLNLSNNHFTGKIPENIGALEQLESLDLSVNNLSGMIPSTMSFMYSLEHLNLSNNNLSGRIPLGNQLQTFCNPSIYSGNPYLNAWSLPWCSNKAPPKSPSQTRGQEEEHGNKDGSKVTWIYLSFALGFIMGLWGFIYMLMFKQATRIAYFQFIDKTFDDICVQLIIRFAKLKTILMNSIQG